MINVFLKRFRKSRNEMPASEIQYSEKYFCKNYEYRHVILPADLARKVPRTHLMTETEWRNLGVQQSPGWIHFMIHDPGNNKKYKSLKCELFIFESMSPMSSFFEELMQTIRTMYNGEKTEFIDLDENFKMHIQSK